MCAFVCFSIHRSVVGSGGANADLKHGPAWDRRCSRCKLFSLGGTTGLGLSFLGGGGRRGGVEEHGGVTGQDYRMASLGNYSALLSMDGGENCPIFGVLVRLQACTLTPV